VQMQQQVNQQQQQQQMQQLQALEGKHWTPQTVHAQMLHIR
jgi:hypothetical protein